jgi:hypothetical protein
MPPLTARTHHAEANGTEQPEQTNHDDVQYTKDAPANLLVEFPRHPIHAEACGKNGEVQSRIVVMDVCDTAHSDEWDVMQDPANERIEPRVVDLVDLGLLEFGVATLPANQVPENQKAKDAKRCSASPIDDRIAEEEVFNNYKGSVTGLIAK